MRLIMLSERLTRRWTETAVECYQRGCVCRGCEIFEKYFSKSKNSCKMKTCVLELVRKHGAPQK